MSIKKTKTVQTIVDINRLRKKTSSVVDRDDVTTWALPKGAIARLGRGREPDIAFSLDGKYLAIGNSLGLWMYDLETLTPTALWETERGMIISVAFSPNGKWIVTSSCDNILKVLDVESGSCLAKLKTRDYIFRLTFSDDSGYLAAAYDRSLYVGVWDMESFDTFADFTVDAENTGIYRPICLSPDSKLIASTCKTSNSEEAEAIVVWELGSGQQITSLISHKHLVTTLCFSPCGQLLTSGGEDGTVHIWDVNTWQIINTYTDYGKVYRIIPSYTPDGILRAAIVNYDDTGPSAISVRDLESDEILFSDLVWGNTTDFSYIGDWGNTVQFSYGSQLAYECRHEYVNVWTTENPYGRQFAHSPISFPKYAMFSGDGKTLAVKHHHEGVILWDIESKRSRPAVKERCVGKNQFVYKTDCGNLYAASIIKDNVTLWKTDDDSDPLINAIDREYWSAHPVLSPTGTLFVYADEDGNLKVYDVRSGEILYELIHPLEPEEEVYDEDDRDSIQELKFSYDGKLLVSESSYAKAKLWDMDNGREITTFPNDKVGGIIGFTPCGRYIFCEGEEILVWDINGNKIIKLGLNQGPFGAISFSDDGKYSILSGDETFVYDINQREIRSQLTLPQECERLFAATFSSCGNYLAAGTWWSKGMEKMSVCLWEAETGKHIVEFRGHVSDIQDVVISPDNKLLATASYDGSILLWDLTPYI